MGCPAAGSGARARPRGTVRCLRGGGAPVPASFALAAGFAPGRLAMPLLSNAWSSDGAWTELWSRSERVVRPLLVLTCTGALTAAILTA